MCKVVVVKKRVDILYIFFVIVQNRNYCFLYFKFQKKYLLLDSTGINSLFHETQISLQNSSSATKQYMIVFDRLFYKKRINNQPSHHFHIRQTISKTNSLPFSSPLKIPAKRRTSRSIIIQGWKRHSLHIHRGRGYTRTRYNSYRIETTSHNI